jgi:hypothetical protein
VPYIIDNRAGDNILIPDGNLNQDFSIDLVGRNYANYGEPIASAFVDLLNNFANNVAPTKQTNGQVWYDAGKKVLRVYDSIGGQWIPLTPLISSAGVPSGENATATSYYDQTNSKFYVNDGTGYKVVGLAGETNTSFSGVSAVGSPARYGTRLRNIFLEDSASVPRAVTAIVLTNSGGASPGYTNEENIVAIFSGHADFTIGNLTSTTEGDSINYYAQLTESGGIGTTIRKGINLRDDNTSIISNAKRSQRSDAAYSINLGSFGSDGANVAGSDIFQAGSDSIPTTTDAVDLGSSTKVFAQGYIKELTIGNGTTGSILSTAGTTAIGSSNIPFDNAYISSLNMSGPVTFSTSANIGSTSARAGIGYFTGLNTANFTIGTQVFPSSDGTNGQQLFTDGSGALFWRDPVSDISNIFARGGTVSSNTTTVVNGVTETTFTIDIGAGNGITVLDDTIAVNLGAFTTDHLAQGTTNKYYTDAQAQAALTFTDAGGLGSLTKSGGTVTYTGPSTADVRAQFASGTGIVLDAGTISANAAQINHDDLSGFVANEHIDHATVSITAGDGLSGGGNILSTRTLDVVGGYGITVNADDVETNNAEVRGLFVAGDGISIDANGKISNTGVLSDPDTSDFVTKAGSQTIGGAKTFTAALVPSGGITMANADFSYTNSLLFSGDTGIVTLGTDGSINADGDITAFSDKRLKEDIKPIENALQKVSELNGYTYKKIGQDKRLTGLIAQEVQQVLPEAVHENEDGMLSVAYGNTVSLLVEAIKELQAQVNDLMQESKRSNGDK